MRAAASLTLKFKMALSDSMKKSGKSHEQFAADLAVAVGCKVSPRMLYRFTAPSELTRFPAAWVDAFCRVAGDDLLKRLLLGPELRELLELGERAAEILNERAQRRVLWVPCNGSPADKRKNGDESCAR
jgi:hypothetical protein